MRLMRVLRDSTRDEMVACFLAGELSSQRFGAAFRAALAASGRPDELLATSHQPGSMPGGYPPD
jgi:hypothetical protein